MTFARMGIDGVLGGTFTLKFTFNKYFLWHSTTDVYILGHLIITNCTSNNFFLQAHAMRKALSYYL